jgi:hypothetical protein
MIEDLSVSQKLSETNTLLREIRDLLQTLTGTTTFTRCRCGRTWPAGQKHACPSCQDSTLAA